MQRLLVCLLVRCLFLPFPVHACYTYHITPPIRRSHDLTITSHTTHTKPRTTREFHCACFFDGQMFIFGGSTGTRRMNDTWRYKLEMEPPSLQILAAHAVLQQVGQFIRASVRPSGRW